MTTSWLGYEKYDEAKDPKRTCAFWNSDGTILVTMDDLPLGKFTIGETRASVTFLPSHLLGWLNNIPKEQVKHKYIAGMFSETHYCYAQMLDDNEMAVSSVTLYDATDTEESVRNWRSSLRLPVNEWREIFKGCCEARDKFTSEIGIRPVFGVNINDNANPSELKGT